MHRFYFAVVAANFDHFQNIYFPFIFLIPVSKHLLNVINKYTETKFIDIELSSK